MALEFTSLNASVSPQYNAGPKGFNTNYNANYNSSRGGAGRGASSSNTFRGNSSSGNRSNLFCKSANELGIPKIGATSCMVTQPTQETQEEEAQDLQQMYILLRIIKVNVKKLLSREGKCH